MKFFLALIILVLLGISTWVLFFSNFSPLKKKVISPQPQTAAITLQITDPDDGEVVTASNLKIAGKAKPGTFLAVFSQNDLQLTKSGKDGGFTVNLKLAEGYNLIKITNFDEGGNSTETALEAFYLTEKFEEILKTKTATNSAGTDDLVQRLTNLRAKKNLKLTAGILKGILGKNLAIKTKTQSRTVNVENSARIGNFSDFSKQLALSQIQAGDFVVGIGNFAQQGILTAKILLVNPHQPPAFGKIVSFGVVSKLPPPAGGSTGEKNNLELTNLLDGKIQLISTENVELYDEQSQKLELKNIIIGNKLLVVGAQKEGRFKAEKILVIAGDFSQEIEKFTTPPPSTQSATSSATSH